MPKIKEIWCMPHSHLDIGYTHPQPLLLNLQLDYLEQAITMCLNTFDYPEESRFCWTVEANYILKKWLETASTERVEQLKLLIREKRICITALPMHTTPNCGAPELAQMLRELNELRKLLGAEITCAINHDVNGQPWTMGQILLDSGIDFYLTGINIHFGGIPFKRPEPFYWEMSDGRKLLSFLGEHYSLFSQFMFTDQHDTSKMQEGVLEYTERLEKQGYEHDFVFLTATNPPLYDNNSPDLELPDLIRKYNEEGYGYKIRLVTADTLREKIIAQQEKLRIYRGDWSDYWNFGCGSTPRETKVNRLAKQAYHKAEVLEVMQGIQGKQYEKAKEECFECSMIFDEHTWGASQSVTEPDHPETYSQLVHKVEKAYRAADLAGYLLSTQMENYCKNPHQSNGMEGISFFNTSSYAQEIEIAYPKSYQGVGRQLSALRTKSYVPYLRNCEELETAGLLKLKPYSGTALSFEQIKVMEEEQKEQERNYLIEDSKVTTPYYSLQYDSKTGRIAQLFDRRIGKNMLDEARDFSLFEPVRETIDTSGNPAARATIFPRNVELGNQSITQWNHAWQGCRLQAEKLAGAVIEEKYKVIFRSEMKLDGMANLVQDIIFYTYKPTIHMKVSFNKEAVSEPEGIYFAVPLCLKQGWECSYDTAGEVVALDKEQMGNVCRDYITVDTGVSMYDDSCCINLSCPDAPLIQVGGFHFGRENHFIERMENPLLLAWTMNNYWDTNFMANPSGAMEFSYELNIHPEFKPDKLLEDGVRSQMPCVLGAAVKAMEQERLFLYGEGNAAILHLYPAKEKNSIIVMIKGLTEKDELFHLHCISFLTDRAEKVSVQEVHKEDLSIVNDTIEIPVQGRTLVLIKLYCKVTGDL